MIPSHRAYTTLGIEPDSDLKTIRRAYRQLVREVDPDKCPSARRFRELREAYETLSKRPQKQRSNPDEQKERPQQQRRRGSP